MINERVLKKMNEYIEEEYVKTITVEELADKLNKTDNMIIVELNAEFTSIAVNFINGIEVCSCFDDENEYRDILIIQDLAEEVTDVRIGISQIKEIIEDSWSCYYLITAKNGDEILITYHC